MKTKVLISFLLCALALFLVLMAFLSLHLIQAEKNSALTRAQQQNEQELKLTVWQLETAALSIFTQSLLETIEQKSTLTNGVFFLDKKTQKMSTALPNQQQDSGFKLVDIEPLQEKLNLSLKQGIARKFSDKSWDSTSRSSQEKDSNYASIQGSGYQQRATNAETQKVATKQILAKNQLWMSNQNLDINDQIDVSKISSYKASWIGEELVLLAEATQADYYEGIWLNREEIERQLLEQVNYTSLHLEPANYNQLALEDGRLKISELDDAFFDNKQILAALPYQVSLSESEVYFNYSNIFKMLSLAWVTLLISILLAGAFMYSLYKMSQRRSEFVSSVTHELRTPLTSFLLYIEMLSTGLVKTEQKKQQYLTTLNKEAKRLNHLVENVLTYSKIERGGSKIEKSEINLQNLIKQIEERLQLRIEATQARLEINNKVSVNAVIKTDAMAIEQIIFNLVDNACKYALDTEDEKLISIDIQIKGKYISFIVTDSGPGIAKYELSKLFTPFHKTDQQASDSQKPGVGLGLSIARRQARLLGGDLKLLKTAKGCSFELKVKK